MALDSQFLANSLASFRALFRTLQRIWLVWKQESSWYPWTPRMFPNYIMKLLFSWLGTLAELCVFKLLKTTFQTVLTMNTVCAQCPQSSQLPPTEDSLRITRPGNFYSILQRNPISTSILQQITSQNLTTSCWCPSTPPSYRRSACDGSSWHHSKPQCQHFQRCD